MSNEEPWRDRAVLEKLLVSAVSGQADAMLPAMIDRAIATYADRTAFVSQGRFLSFREIGERADSYANSLRSLLGSAQHVRIAVMLPNIDAFPVACIGNIQSGFAHVNVNPNYTLPELRHQLVDSGAEVLVLWEPLFDRFGQIASETQVSTVIVVSEHGMPDRCRSVLSSSIKVLCWQDVVMPKTARFPRMRSEARNPLFLQYTGGTTGISKGALLTVGNVSANIIQFHLMAFGLVAPGANVVVTSLPLYHIFGLTINFLCCFVAGFTNILIADARDIDAMVATIRSSRFNFITGVNTTFDVLAGHPEIANVDFSGLRLAMGGGTQILPHTSAKWAAVSGKPIKIGYGLSETSPLVTMQPIDEEEFRPDIGYRTAWTDTMVLDDDDMPVAEGETGELCIAGPQVMSGYLNDPRPRADSFFADRFFRTGDLVRQDRDGRFTIVDRKKDMVIVSGFNVFPSEIEAVATLHPTVAEAMCVGIADARSGEAVKLYVVPSLEHAFVVDDLLDFCRTQLTGYKVPKYIELVDHVPKSPVGKPLRRLLRKS